MGDTAGERLGETERRPGESDLDLIPVTKDGMDGTDIHFSMFFNGFTEGKALKILSGPLVGFFGVL